MKSPLAVLISDVHYSIQNLELADASLRAALKKADFLSVPLIVAGDLHDTKSLLNSKCVDAMITAFTTCPVRSYVIPGNHCKENEKSEGHALGFLREHVYRIVDQFEYFEEFDAHLMPYQHDTNVLSAHLDHIRSKRLSNRLIAHQGISGAHMGAYVIDKTSLPSGAWRSIETRSGHYHRAQTIQVHGGSFQYIGSPYTVTASESTDGPKGFQILYNDFTMEQVPLPLRKHVTVQCEASEVMNPIEGLNPNDLLWLKVSGTHFELDKLNKKAIGKVHLGHSNFKLDLIQIDTKVDKISLDNLTDSEVLDLMIDKEADDAHSNKALKTLWREIV